LIALSLVFFIAPWASSLPDGLEWVARTAGFESKAAASPIVAGPMPDYTLPGIQSAAWSTVWSGAAGTVAAFIMAWLLAMAATRRDRAPAIRENAPPTA
jgi:ABC-type Fe3+ transport system permease subunit